MNNYPKGKFKKRRESLWENY